MLGYYQNKRDLAKAWYHGEIYHGLFFCEWRKLLSAERHSKLNLTHAAARNCVLIKSKSLMVSTKIANLTVLNLSPDGAEHTI